MITGFTKRILASFFLIFLLIFLLQGCGGEGSEDEDGSEDSEGQAALSAVNDFLYQLQGRNDGIDLEAIGETAFDLVVMDYSQDGSEDGEFSSSQIAALKDSPGGSKIVLAYMSIGEAEEGRFYFDPAWVDPDTKEVQPGAPGFLAPSNPDFPDNFKVRFWEDEWQAIIFGAASGGDKSYLDRIIDAGFDGVYLDIIDAFEFFGPGGELPERPTAGEDMIDFVLAIANYARDTRGKSDFLVFPQNGAGILEEEGGANYLAAVDGIGTEDTFYFGEEENNNDLDLEHADEVTPFLDQFVEGGKTVLAIDYVQTSSKVSDFYSRAREKGYIPYASTRLLDSITINEGFEPD